MQACFSLEFLIGSPCDPRYGRCNVTDRDWRKLLSEPGRVYDHALERGAAGTRGIACGTRGTGKTLPHILATDLWVREATGRRTRRSKRCHSRVFCFAARTPGSEYSALRHVCRQNPSVVSIASQTLVSRRTRTRESESFLFCQTPRSRQTVESGQHAVQFALSRKQVIIYLLRLVIRKTLNFFDQLARAHRLSLARSCSLGTAGNASLP